MKIESIGLRGILCLAVVGCSSAPAGDPEPSAAANEAKIEAAPDVGTSKHLTSLVFSDGRAMRFYQTQFGDVLVVEEGKIGQPSLVPSAQDSSPLALFKAAAPTLEVPAQLARAADAAKAVTALAPLPEETTSASPSSGAGQKFYTAGEMAWFQTSICQANNVNECFTGGQWARTSWDTGRKTTGIDAWAIVGSEDTQPGTFIIDHWGCNCSFLFVCCGDGWSTVWSNNNLTQGFWQHAWNSYRGSSRASVTLNNNGTGSVGIADKYNVF